MKVLSKLIAKASLNTAKKASGSASQWLSYQPKEPAKLKELLSKNK